MTLVFTGWAGTRIWMPEHKSSREFYSPFHLHQHSSNHHPLSISIRFFIIVSACKKNEPWFFFVLNMEGIIQVDQGIGLHFKPILLTISMDHDCISKLELAQIDKRAGQAIGQIDMTGKYAIPIPGCGWPPSSHPACLPSQATFQTPFFTGTPTMGMLIFKEESQLLSHQYQYIFRAEHSQVRDYVRLKAGIRQADGTGPPCRARHSNLLFSRVSRVAIAIQIRVDHGPVLNTGDARIYVEVENDGDLVIGTLAGPVAPLSGAKRACPDNASAGKASGGTFVVTQGCRGDG